MSMHNQITNIDTLSNITLVLHPWIYYWYIIDVHKNAVKKAWVNYFLSVF